MTNISAWVNKIREALPNVEVELDEAPDPASSSFCAFRLADYRLSVEIRRPLGFGLSGGYDMAFGEGPHEVYRDPGHALSRVVQLLRTGKATKPADELILGQLRTLRGVSQEQVAARLGLRQASS